MVAIAIPPAPASAEDPSFKIWNGTDEVDVTKAVWNGSSEVSLTPSIKTA